jgi:AAA15 family ATPase/GTPase
MIKKFQIENFRGFSSLEIEGCERFNVITGFNNVGKTALLEALFLHIGPTNPELPLRLQGFRGIQIVSTSADSLWSPIFYKFNSEIIISLKSFDQKNRENRLEIKTAKDMENIGMISEPGAQEGLISSSLSPIDKIELKFVNSEGKIHRSYAKIDPDGQLKYEHMRASKDTGIFVFSRGRGGQDADAERYSYLDSMGKTGIILEILKKIEPRLIRLSVVASKFGSSIHGDVGIGRLIPIQLLGDGTSRLLTLALSISALKGGLVLIDEIENGIHYSIMSEIIDALLALAEKQEVQLFATTHSEDFLRALRATATKQDTEKFALYRLDRSHEQIKSVRYGQNSIIEALEAGWEIRG